MSLACEDWAALTRLRQRFLDGTAGQADYWTSEKDLAAYDATFAQRIGWKWDHVLLELRQRGWTPPPGELMDWGCGSGVAARAFLDHFGTEAVSGLRLFDRSARAMAYAAHRARQKYPGLAVSIGAQPAGPAGTLVLSHVLTELDTSQRPALLALLRSFACLLWVEPGTFEASWLLIAVREELRGQYHLVAPCTHDAPCGLLARGNERHWCHHFAASPPEIYTDGDWARFATMAGVDLRSLPLSYLVLDTRPAPALPPGAVRVIGHPRLFKAEARCLGCDAAGACESSLPKRALPEAFRALRKENASSLQIWQRDGSVITQWSQ